jgi:long-chain acyl-CoA synthetase
MVSFRTSSGSTGPTVTVGQLQRDRLRSVLEKSKIATITNGIVGQAMKHLLVEYLDDFNRRGDEVAFVYQRGLRISRWSYREVAIGAGLFAKRLEAHGICRSDRVLLWAENSAEWVVAFFGCLLRGTIVVPLDVKSTPDFVRKVQQQVEAKLALLDVTTQKQFGLDLPDLLLEEIQRPTSTSVFETPQPIDTASSEDTAEIIFTSGTTGEPKGVRISNQNLLANLAPLEQEIQRYLKWEKIVHPIRFLNLLPLSHVFGQFMGFFVPQLLRAEVFFADSLNASHIIETVKRNRISVIVTVPRILELLREHIERELEKTKEGKSVSERISKAQNWNAARRWWAFSAIHRAFGLKFWGFISGGATLNDETEDFWRRLGFVVIQGYGMTETASLISVNHPFKQGRGSIGKVMPGQELKLADNGEILVRGQNVSAGYWKDGQQTSLDDDGWLHTGDIGEFDGEGNLYFKGRQKDVIVTGAGMKVYPADIEAALNLQPGVKTSVVITFAGPRGPEPLAVLVLRDEQRDPKEVVNGANAVLAEHQLVRRWYVWPDQDFPRTPTGKIRKQIVAEKVAEALAGKSPGERTPGGLEELIARAGGDVAAKLEPNLNLATDLKLDSLGRVELLGEIEARYQIEINEDSFSAATTVADIERIIREGESDPVAGYLYPRWPHRWPFNWLRIGLLYTVVLPFTYFLGRPIKRGEEHLKGVTGPLLFVCNHLTIVDQALILWALPGRLRRRMSIAMDGELLREWMNPPPNTTWFIRLRYRVQYLLVALFFNVFSMPQHSGFRRSFSFAGQMVDRGYSLLVFPEGRRSPDGKLHEFKAGIGLLARDLNIPIVPARIDGLYELAREGKHHASLGEISVTIGKPVNYAVKDEIEDIVRDIEERVRNL